MSEAAIETLNLVLWIIGLSYQCAVKKPFLVKAVHHFLNEVVIMCSFYFLSWPHFKVTLM